ncbi:MAG: HAD family hydrolase [Candidatus Margulisbacteria bacterium]|nr:HAD family hydrolase [Candidatus Margulisiibacteriota bacterium]
MIVKAVIFDLDGTLLDTITDITNSMNNALKDLCLPTFSEEDYKYLVGSGLDRLVGGVLPQHITDEQTIALFVEKFREYYDNKWTEHSVPFEGILELLSCLQNKGIKQAILSNKPHLITVAMTAKLLPANFELVYGERLSEGIPKKPDPQVLLEMAKSLKVKPDEVLYVGDSDVDMQVAVNAGMIGVGVLWGFRTKEELVNNGAKYIVARPEEINNIIGREKC